MRYLEAAKSLLLAGLVTASLFLSAQIWSGAALKYSAVGYDDYFRPVVALPPLVELRELVSPDRIVVHTEDGPTAFLPGFHGHTRAWEPVTAILDSSLPGPTSPHPLPEVGGTDTIEMVLPVAVPFEVWVAMWHDDSASRLTAAAVERVVLLLDVPAAYLALSDGGHSRLQLGPTASAAFAELEAFTREVRSARLPGYVDAGTVAAGLRMRDGIYVPDPPPALAPLQSQPETLTAEETASLFFADLSGMTRIVEPDGATIFTDGRRAVRVYESGFFEFTDADPGPLATASNVTALARAMDYVSRRGGLPAGFHLSGFEPGPVVTVTFSFRYRGLPVADSRGTIVLRVDGTHVVEYRRQGRVPIGPASVPTPLIDVAGLFEIISSGLERHPALGDDEVTDVRLAYIYSDPTLADPGLRPAWLVEFSRQTTVVVDALTGEGWLWTGLERRQF